MSHSHAEPAAAELAVHEKSALHANMSLDMRDGDANARDVDLQTADRLTEEWRPVPGYEGWTDVSSLGGVRRWYARSGRGRVVTLEAPRLTAPQCKPGVRPVLCLRNELGSVQVPLHRAVLAAFLGEPPEAKPGVFNRLMGCHFPDANPGNCRLSNLRWDTPDANGSDEQAHRTRSHDLVLRRLLWLREHHPHLSTSVDGIWFSRLRPLKPRTRVPRELRRRVLYHIRPRWESEYYDFSGELPEPWSEVSP